MKNYKEKKWISIIPSLLEIAILNLYNTFKKTYYSENDLSSEAGISQGTNALSSYQSIFTQPAEFKIDLGETNRRCSRTHMQHI